MGDNVSTCRVVERRLPLAAKWRNCPTGSCNHDDLTSWRILFYGLMSVTASLAMSIQQPGDKMQLQDQPMILPPSDRAGWNSSVHVSVPIFFTIQTGWN